MLYALWAIQLLRHSEVCNLHDFFVARKEDVQGFEVLMHHQHVVDVLYRRDELPTVLLYLLDCDFVFVILNVLIEVTPFQNLHDHMYLMHPRLGRVLSHQILVLQYIRMTQVMSDVVLTHVRTHRILGDRYVLNNLAILVGQVLLLVFAVVLVDGDGADFTLGTATQKPLPPYDDVLVFAD